MKIRANKMAGMLTAARRDRTGKQDYVPLPGGNTVIVESASERDFWEGYAEALESGQIKPEEFSIRNIFEAVIPDGRALLDHWEENRGGSSISLQEAAGAVSVSAFSNITGQIIYTKVNEGYTAPQFVFTGMIPNIPTKFDGERIPGIGGIGDNAGIVEEGNSYPLVGVTEDYQDTPHTTKRGLTCPVTKEAIFFDRTGLILRRAGEVGNVLGLNKEKRIIDCFIDENTTAHRYNWRGASYATYQASTPWINSKTSNGLENWSNLDAVELLAANMVDPTTGEPIEVMLDTLVVNPQNLHNAERVLHALQLLRLTGGYATSGNLNQSVSANTIGKIPNYSPPYKIVTSKLMQSRTATDTDWFLSNPAKAFGYMENWPLAVVSAPAGSEEEFNRDIVHRFKASERGAAAVLDPRYTFKSAA